MQQCYAGRAIPEKSMSNTQRCQKMKMSAFTLIFSLLLFDASCLSPATNKYDKIRQPSIPSWPHQFMINFDVYVKVYGKDWSSTGTLYYDWTTKTFRADYFDWCFPLSNTDNPNKKDNFTCTFLATEGNMYYVNHTADEWKDYECCMFQTGLEAVPPDWMKICMYNGTDVIKNVPVDVWWSPGTSNPSNPCFWYWNAKDDIDTPVQFFGVSTIGPTLLSYHDFKPNVIPRDIEMGFPNGNCNKECSPSLRKILSKRSTQNTVHWWPKWPSCD